MNGLGKCGKCNGIMYSGLHPLMPEVIHTSCKCGIGKCSRCNRYISNIVGCCDCIETRLEEEKSRRIENEKRQKKNDYWSWNGRF
jgi:hypothetical protein